MHGFKEIYKFIERDKYDFMWKHFFLKFVTL